VKYTSVYSRAETSHWYIVYWCPMMQKRVHRATPFLTTDPQGKRKAMEWANERSKDASIDKGTAGSERWEVWVEDYLKARYAGPHRVKTLGRYLGAWGQWQLFLSENNIPVPRALTYNHVLGFIKWRTAQRRTVARTLITKNTALLDVKVMSVVMREAFRRGFAQINPCERLGILKDMVKEKPAITDAEFAKIREALKSRPEWMQVSFEIAAFQGCRLSATSLPLSGVNIEEGTIRFTEKRRGNGQLHIFTTFLHHGLRPLMASLKASGATVTCTLPQMPSKEWWAFFREIGLPHLCFHCLRVSAITRMAQAGVPIAKAMRYVSHASLTIHRIYQRLAPEDLECAAAAVSFSSGEMPQIPGDEKAIPEASVA